MIDSLKDFILNSQEMPFPVAHKRSLKVVAMPQKATICVGVRRCGKSTFMRQIMKELTDAGGGYGASEFFRRTSFYSIAVQKVKK